MEENNKAENSEYRIVKKAMFYFVERKYYNPDTDSMYWAKMTYLKDEVPFNYIFCLLTDARKFIELDKSGHDSTEKIIEYL